MSHVVEHAVSNPDLAWLLTHQLARNGWVIFMVQFPGFLDGSYSKMTVLFP
jgi:hypothetical protein